MQNDLGASHTPYRGWEIRSHLTHVSPEGTVAAGAAVFIGDDCKCHIVSCRQFVNGGDALLAIERKAALWIDSLETSPGADLVEPALLS